MAVVWWFVVDDEDFLVFLVDDDLGIFLQVNLFGLLDIAAQNKFKATHLPEGFLIFGQIEVFLDFIVL